MLVLGTFLEISIILVIATVIAGIMKLLKQPLIIGHIITGILVGPFFFDLVKSGEIINVFSQIGVALLLFIVGLTLSPRVIREVGKVSLVTGLGQIIFTSIIGFFISRALGFSNIVSLYIAIALTFSSTIIIMKLLSDKHDVEKLYGKVSIGFLLVQDVVAIIILIVVSSISNELNLTNSLAQTIAGHPCYYCQYVHPSRIVKVICKIPGIAVFIFNCVGSGVSGIIPLLWIVYRDRSFNCRDILSNVALPS